MLPLTWAPSAFRRPRAGRILGVLAAGWGAFASAAGPQVPSFVPLGLPPIDAEPSPPEAVIALGSNLFRDPRLSIDGTLSCATCHEPSRDFTDGRATAHGRGHRVLSRRVPSLNNVVYRRDLFWDGRAADLTEQVRSPLTSPVEHGLTTDAEVLRAIHRARDLEHDVAAAFGISPAAIRVTHLQTALAAYETTLLSGNSPVDRYLYGNDASALSPSAVRGLHLFRGRARCATCHTMGEKSALFTDDHYHAGPAALPDSTLAHLPELTAEIERLQRRGASGPLSTLIATRPDVSALGRYLATLEPTDIGRFRTPSLRNVAVRPPYFHDGHATSLEEAIDQELYGRSGGREPIVLTTDERADLRAFLEALTSAEPR